MSISSYDQVWSLSSYTLADDTAAASSETSAYHDLRQVALPDERIPASYGQDLTGWYVLREILDDLRNERVLI